MAAEKFETLAIDPEVENRMRLKQATASVTTFGKFNQSNSLDEALKKLQLPERTDVVFISDRLNSEAIPNFIKSAKGLAAGQDAAYVMIVKTHADLAPLVAKAVLLGIDGFLCEPYSVDSLLEITRLAAKVRKERFEAREEVAIRFLMNQIVEQISVVAQLKSYNMSAAREQRKLEDMCSIFKTLEEEARERYHKIAVEVFESAPVPKPLLKKTYGGASSRVKARMEKKVLSQLAGDEAKPAEQV